MTAEEERRGSRLDGAAAAAGTGPLDQAFDADSLYALRAAVAAHASAAGLNRHRVYDVTAVAHELAANAVVHGAGHGRLRLWTDGDFLFCEVSDDGQTGATDQPGHPANGSAPWPVEYGHGLWLAWQIAEHVSIAHGPAGTTATATFPLNAGQAAHSGR